MDSFSLKKPLGLPNEIMSGDTRAGSITNQAGMDTWTFLGGSGDRVIITVVTTSGSLAPRIYLSPPPPGILEGQTDSGRLDHRLQTNGTYTIEIEDAYGSHTGAYNITLLKMPGPVSSAGDPDGGAIASGQTLSGGIEVPSDTDGFQFYGTNNDRVVITVVATNGNLAPRIYLYPPGGGNWEGETDTGRLEYQLQTNGLYTIEIEDAYGSHTGAYNISFTNIPPDLRRGIYNPHPPDTSTVTNTADSFSWDPVAGATGYDLYFGTNVVVPLQWIGTNLVSPTMPFPPLDGGKVYYWHVVARLPAGIVTGPYWWFYVSNACWLTITAQPQSRTNVVGDSVAFQVVASGSGTLAYQWRFNGTNLLEGGQFSGTTTSNLTITSIQASNTGNYDVIVTSDCGAVTTSTRATLTVWYAPNILVPPRSQTVSPGSDVSFTVSAIGNPPPAYQWQFNGADIPGATGTNYIARNAQCGSAGTYRVTASNSLGTASASATLSLLSLQVYAGLTICGPAGAVYRIEYTDQVNTSRWQLLTNLSLPSSPYLFIDRDSPNQPMRFYRAITP
jgi:hypothetical protein